VRDIDTPAKEASLRPELKEMVGQRITFFGILVSFLLMPISSYAATFSDPEIPNGQTLYYQYKTGRYPSKYLVEVKKREEVVRSSSRITMEHSEKGEKIYRIQDYGVRRSGQSFERLSRIIVQEDGLAPLSFVARDTTPTGKVVREFEAFFDDPSLDYPPNTFPVFCVVQAMRGISFQKDEKLSFYLWVTPTQIYRMNFDDIKEETIKVPAGKIPCYYGMMRPDIRTILPIGNLLAKLLRPFVPKYHFWFSREASHPLVKFEGVLGGAGAARHTIELTRLENPAPEGQPPVEIHVEPEKQSP